MASAWGKSWGAAFGASWGALVSAPAAEIENIVPSGPDDESAPHNRIKKQNHVLLQLIAAFVASGALE